MLEYDEKREYIRMETHCKMTYKYVDSEQEHEALCLNLSGAGVLFHTSENIEAGKALEIRITPENSITPPMVAFIEVLRATPLGEQNCYEVAATLKGIKEN